MGGPSQDARPRLLQSERNRHIPLDEAELVLVHDDAVNNHHDLAIRTAQNAQRFEGSGREKTTAAQVATTGNPLQLLQGSSSRSTSVNRGCDFALPSSFLGRDICNLQYGLHSEALHRFSQYGSASIACVLRRASITASATVGTQEDVGVLAQRAQRVATMLESASCTLLV